RFQAFSAALHDGASLGELERLSIEVREEVVRTLRGTAAVPIGVTLICLVALPIVVPALPLDDDGARTFACLMRGAPPQGLSLSATLLLYYFDFRAEAFVGAAVQLFTNGIFTATVALGGGQAGIGYAIACALSCAASIALLQRRMRGLLERTFQEQPYSSEV